MKINIFNQDIRGNVNNINWFEEKQTWKKLTYYQRMQRYACVADSPTREKKQVGYANKSVWWMPWH